MKRQQKTEYKVNLIGETDLNKLTKEELDLLITYFTDGLKKYIAEEESAAD